MGIGGNTWYGPSVSTSDSIESASGLEGSGGSARVSWVGLQKLKEGGSSGGSFSAILCSSSQMCPSGWACSGGVCRDPGPSNAPDNSYPSSCGGNYTNETIKESDVDKFPPRNYPPSSSTGGGSCGGGGTLISQLGRGGNGGIDGAGAGTSYGGTAPITCDNVGCGGDAVPFADPSGNIPSGGVRNPAFTGGGLSSSGCGGGGGGGFGPGGSGGPWSGCYGTACDSPPSCDRFCDDYQKANGTSGPNCSPGVECGKCGECGLDAKCFKTTGPCYCPGGECGRCQSCDSETGTCKSSSSCDPPPGGGNGGNPPPPGGAPVPTGECETKTLCTDTTGDTSCPSGWTEIGRIETGGNLCVICELCRKDCRDTGCSSCADCKEKSGKYSCVTKPDCGASCTDAAAAEKGIELVAVHLFAPDDEDCYSTSFPPRQLFKEPPQITCGPYYCRAEGKGPNGCDARVTWVGTRTTWDRCKCISCGRDEDGGVTTKSVPIGVVQVYPSCRRQNPSCAD